MSDFSKFRVVSSFHLGSTWANTLSYAPDGRRYLAVCLMVGTKVFESATDRLLFTLNARAPLVFRAVWSPCGRIIALATDSGIVLFDALMGAELRRWSAGRTVRVMSFSPCGTRLLSGDGSHPTVCVWDVAATKLVCDISAENEADTPTRSAFFLPGDAASVISVSSDGRVSINSANDGRLLRRFELGAGDVVSMVLSPSGSHIAARIGCGTARVFSVADGSQVWQELGGDVTSLAWAYDSVVMAGSRDASVTFFDVARNAALSRVQLPVSSSWALDVALRPDRRQLMARCSDGMSYVLEEE